MEVRNIASCNILVPNNNPLEDFPGRFLFCREINQLLEYTYCQGAQDLSIQIQHIVQWAFLQANFLKSILRGGDDLLLKNGTLDGYAY